MGERHGDIKRRGPRMIAHARPDPTDTGFLSFFDCQYGGAVHYQMAHAVVAVDQRHRCAFADDANIRRGIDAAGAQPAYVKRQPNHAMSIAAAQIRLDHVARDRLGLGFRQPGGDESACHECAELCGRDAGFISRHFLGPALIHFQSMPNRGQSHDAEVTGAASRQIIRSIEVTR